MARAKQLPRVHRYSVEFKLSAASNWKCLRSSGSLPVNLSNNQWHLQGVRPRRRRRNPDFFQDLP